VIGAWFPGRPLVGYERGGNRTHDLRITRVADNRDCGFYQRPCSHPGIQEPTEVAAVDPVSRHEPCHADGSGDRSVTRFVCVLLSLEPELVDMRPREASPGPCPTRLGHAGADSIGEMALLRHGGIRRLFPGIRAPFTLGTSCGRSPCGTSGQVVCGVSSPNHEAEPSGLGLTLNSP
jgi:hypothetical protein